MLPEYPLAADGGSQVEDNVQPRKDYSLKSSLDNWRKINVGVNKWFCFRYCSTLFNQLFTSFLKI
jgi:hypothetical protein